MDWFTCTIYSDKRILFVNHTIDKKIVTTTTIKLIFNLLFFIILTL